MFENILEIKNNNLLINATMHGGSLAAVVIFFYKDLLGLWKNHRLLINLIIATLPVIVIGGLLKYFEVIEQIMNIAVIGYATIFFGILLFISDKNKQEKKLISSISNKEAFIIGSVSGLSTHSRNIKKRYYYYRCKIFKI